jgi:hypothetical protein
VLRASLHRSAREAVLQRQQRQQLERRCREAEERAEAEAVARARAQEGGSVVQAALGARVAELEEKLGQAQCKVAVMTGGAADASAAHPRDLTLAELEQLEKEMGRGLEVIRATVRAKLEHSMQSAQATGRCICCEDQQINVVLLPCRHHLLCSDCVPRLDSCPICRIAIAETVVTFGR